MILLNSMDLPTLGRPMAIKGLDMGISSFRCQKRLSAWARGCQCRSSVKTSPAPGKSWGHGPIIQEYILLVPEHAGGSAHGPGACAFFSWAAKSCPVKRPATSMVWPKKSLFILITLPCTWGKRSWIRPSRCPMKLSAARPVAMVKGWERAHPP